MVTIVELRASNPSKPHPVGVKTLRVGEGLCEMWYPANRSAQGLDQRWDLQDRYERSPGAPAVRYPAVRDLPPLPNPKAVLALLSTEIGEEELLAATLLASRTFKIVASRDPVETARALPPFGLVCFPSGIENAKAILSTQAVKAVVTIGVEGKPLARARLTPTLSIDKLDKDSIGAASAFLSRHTS